MTYIIYIIGIFITAGIIHYTKKDDSFLGGEDLLDILTQIMMGLFWPLLLILYIIKFIVKKIANICAFIDGIHHAMKK